MSGKMFPCPRRAAAAVVLALAAGVADPCGAQSGPGGSTLSVPAGGIRWGQDTIQFSRTGTCSGTTMDFGMRTLVFGPVDDYPSLALHEVGDAATIGTGIHPNTVPCVGGTYQLSATIQPIWFTSTPVNYPFAGNSHGLLPGTHSLYGDVWYRGHIVPYTAASTPAVTTDVRFDHPYYIAELSTGVTPIGGAARYLDPYSSPVPLPGIPSPRLIEITNGASPRTLVGMTHPVTVGPGMLWVNDPLPSQPMQWRMLTGVETDTLLSGNMAILPVMSSPGYIAFSGALLAPTPPAAPVTPQADIWWAGETESGWGLSIGRNGDALFVAGFIYDYGGKPTWAVMQGGAWDASHTAWTADVYIPHGAPFDHYDASQFNLQALAGKATLQFSTPTSATFQYLGGYKHAIQRYQFASAAPGAYHGYWFGGAAQSGWGLHVAQQGDTIFATWYTYGADGTPTWFFMPGATKLSATHYSGGLYRTTGGSWPTMEHYDPNATKATAAGTLDLSFTSDSAGTMTAVVDGKTITTPIQRFGF